MTALTDQGQRRRAERVQAADKGRVEWAGLRVSADGAVGQRECAVVAHPTGHGSGVAGEGAIGQRGRAVVVEAAAAKSRRVAANCAIRQ